jgi:dTDP-D-glucose 4,6-dehydratase
VIKIIESGQKNQIFNIAGGFEQSNIDTVKKIINIYFNNSFDNYDDYINFDIHRPGQDIRYALNDDKIRSLDWKPICIFDNELKHIVEYYKNNFIW